MQFFFSDIHYKNNVRQKSWYNPTTKKTVRYSENFTDYGVEKVNRIIQSLREKGYKITIKEYIDYRTQKKVFDKLIAVKKTKFARLKRVIENITYTYEVTERVFKYEGHVPNVARLRKFYDKTISFDEVNTIKQHFIEHFKAKRYTDIHSTKLKVELAKVQQKDEYLAEIEFIKA